MLLAGVSAHRYPRATSRRPLTTLLEIGRQALGYSMMNMSRRNFTHRLLGSLLSFSLVKALLEDDLLAQSIKPLANRWLIDLEQISKELKGANLRQTDWQNKVAELFTHVELSDILRTINFDHLAKRIRLSNDREAIREIKLSSLDGVPKDLTYSTLFEALKKGRAIAPHGHRNMATVHLILRGQVHLRQYDRLRNERDYLIIRPTVDRLSETGELSTMSDDKDNIHWFRGVSEVTYIFNAGIYGVNASEGFTAREYIDPSRGQRIEGEMIRVRKLNQEEAFRLYNRAEE
jgi:hypothetical protein